MLQDDEDDMVMPVLGGRKTANTGYTAPHLFMKDTVSC